MRRRLFCSTAVLAAVWAGGAEAQTAPPMPVPPVVRVRGAVAGLSGETLTVDTRDGQKLEIAFPEKATVASVKKTDLASIKPGDFIGTATRTGTDGTMQAIEVLVFPEAARGTGEGSYPWDLEPGSTMTNGTVKGAVTAAKGRELSIGFKDSGNTVVVPEGTPIVTLAPASRDDLKPGTKVFLVATKGADGKLTAMRATVGKDGVNPPM